MGCPTTQGNLKKLLSKTMSQPFFPFPFDKLKADINYSGECPVSLHIDSIEIFPINLSHPNSGMGYKFVEDGKVFVFLTDNELGYRHRNGQGFEEYSEFAQYADLLIHDAEFTKEEYEKTRTWGHSTYEEALMLALDANVKQFGLFHHNQERSDQALDDIVRSCRHTTRNRNSRMVCFAVYSGIEIHL